MIIGSCEDYSMDKQALAYHRHMRRVAKEIKEQCPLCLGTGDVSNMQHLGVLGRTCPRCNGRGWQPPAAPTAPPGGQEEG